MSDEIAGVVLGILGAGLGLLGLTMALSARWARRARTCPWYSRGWHRAARQADIQFVWQALRASARATSAPRHTVVDGWRLHQTLPGSAHWTCPCGRIASALFEAAVVTPYLEHRDRLRYN